MDKVSDLLKEIIWKNNALQIYVETVSRLFIVSFYPIQFWVRKYPLCTTTFFQPYIWLFMVIN